MDRLALTDPGQLVVLAGTAVLFLPVPDVDQLALRVLRHRSILTHSLLVPLLVGWLAAPLGPAAAAGAALGVAVHLAADLLSKSKGYGRVWFPWPLKGGLGGWSALWLMGNALGSAALAFLWLPAGLREAGALVGMGAAVGYGVLRERRILAVAAGLGVVAGGWWLTALSGTFAA